MRRLVGTDLAVAPRRVRRGEQAGLIIGLTQGRAGGARRAIARAGLARHGLRPAAISCGDSVSGRCCSVGADHSHALSEDWAIGSPRDKGIVTLQVSDFHRVRACPQGSSSAGGSGIDM